MNFDAVIIGGGLGGLTAGASLATRGKKVLLIEQHYFLGGCASIFRRRNYNFEVSLHELDGMDALDPKAHIFDELGLKDRIELIPLPSFYRFVHGQCEFVMPHGIDNAKEALVRRFPHEREAIVGYIDLLVEIRSSLNGLQLKHMSGMAATLIANPSVMRLRHETLGSFLDKTFKDEELKLILVGSLSYFASDPYELSFIYFALGQASYLVGGSYYVKGGSQALSNALADVIRAKSGAILLRREVTEILVRGNRVTGVKFRRTHGPSRDEGEAYAPAVIANNSILNIAAMLPARIARGAGFESYRRMKPSLSATNVYFGLKRPLSELGNQHYFSAHFTDDLRCLADLRGRSLAHPTPWSFNLVDYSQIDSGLTKAPRSTVVVNLMDTVQRWSKLDAEAYRREKSALVDRVTSHLEKLYPGFSDAVEMSDASTPLTIARYTRNPGGGIYGFAQTPDQTWIRRPDIRSPLPGLYFASAWSRPGGGFTGVMLSGHNAAREVAKGAAAGDETHHFEQRKAP